MQLMQRDRKSQEMKPYLNSEIIRVIDEVVHSARDRKVLRLRYVDGLTYEQIAEANFEADPESRKAEKEFDKALEKEPE